MGATNFIPDSASLVRYLTQHAEEIPEESWLGPPNDSLKLCIVIPATGERKTIQSVLGSLEAGSERIGQAEVIVVVNNPKDARRERLEENLATIQDLKSLRGPLRLIVLDRASRTKAYPAEKAGVGTARRCGMDLAFRRLLASGQPASSAIACLDADSPVSPGYIDELLSVFDTLQPPLAGVCQYRHPIPQDESLAQSIVAYELWLRYLEWGMRLSGSPYAFQTVGSCLTISPLGYALINGMPRRRAAEDFYFLQKIVKAGGPQRIVPIPGAHVFPSARISDRVPFGTGRAMRRCQQEGPASYFYVEPPRAFQELRRFFKGLSEWFLNPNGLHELAGPQLHAFLKRRDGLKVFNKLRANASSPEHFEWAVHTWLDSLQVVRYVRACKKSWGGVWVLDALADVFAGLNLSSSLEALPGCAATDADLESMIRWLDRLRGIEENPCAPRWLEGMNPS